MIEGTYDHAHKFSTGVCSCPSAIDLRGALAIGGMILRPSLAPAESDPGISHTEESIHQEPSFNAGRQRVYQALTTTEQFDHVIQLSGVMQSAPMATRKKPTAISGHAGGEFVLFGGLIVGRHIELVPDELIVQAWRDGAWDRGVYSIVTFNLTELGTGTKILFDHTGFPKAKRDIWRPVGKPTTGRRSRNSLHSAGA